jgi:hypothetical protein
VFGVGRYGDAGPWMRTTARRCGSWELLGDVHGRRGSRAVPGKEDMRRVGKSPN